MDYQTYRLNKYEKETDKLKDISKRTQDESDSYQDTNIKQN